MKAFIFSFLLFTCTIHSMDSIQITDSITPTDQDKFSLQCAMCSHKIKRFYLMKVESAALKHYKRWHNISSSPQQLYIQEPFNRYNCIARCPIAGCHFVLKRTNAPYNYLHDLKSRMRRHALDRHKCKINPVLGITIINEINKFEAAFHLPNNGEQSIDWPFVAEHIDGSNMLPALPVEDLLAIEIPGQHG